MQERSRWHSFFTVSGQLPGYVSELRLFSQNFGQSGFKVVEGMLPKIFFEKLQEEDSFRTIFLTPSKNLQSHFHLMALTGPTP